MNLTELKDQELLSMTKQLVQKERQVLTQVLQHLKEVERRKLFSDLGCSSLFEYAVKELKYSEGQAGRRIQAMRLIKEVPEVEKKIKSGKLSLTNISQAQSYFREAKKKEPKRIIKSKEKLEVLGKLENKSSREGQKVLLQMQPQKQLPKERERILTESHSEIRFIINEEIKTQLEELRSLLGPKGAAMSFSELVKFMLEVSIENIKVRKFGKKGWQIRS